MSDAATVDPRFVCRREGHVPAIKVTFQNATTDRDATYLTPCARCGKPYEEPMPRAS